MINNRLDITPTPRILRTLGEIPFQTWQCFAELIDNSIDAFLSNANDSYDDTGMKITITWASDAIAAKDRTIEITDNAHGMSIDQLQNAVRAGYSSNDPVGNLGLFGMGFNISTARLGETTTILTSREGDEEWIGVTIDFGRLIEERKFDAPIVKRPKKKSSDHGTQITIGNLRNGILNELPYKENEIRQRLEAIYSPLLTTHDITIIVKGKQLRAQNHCVWSDQRYVRYNDQNVPAFIPIDRNLGDALFDLSKNCYLTPDESEQYYLMQQNGEQLPSNIIERCKRLTGWLGIQRYADPNDFGIDFIRNGRKILVSDKSLFQYENPYTGQKELQYPVELGSTTGGRIVGELNVDYLLPTYQKNDFDRSDRSWVQTVEAICGVGPFLPKSRKALGFTEPNNSPLCILANAYRRVDKGTKCLFAPNDIAKRYAVEFKKGTRGYLDDTLWWKAAQEEDQKQVSGGNRATTAVNTGDTPSDDIDAYLSGTSISVPTVDKKIEANGTSINEKTGANVVDTTQTNQLVIKEQETSQLDELIQRSSVVSQLSGRNYRFGNTGSLNVRAYELNKGSILYHGDRRPCFFYSDGIDCDFIYDPTHPLLAQYPITPKMLLLIYLSEKLKARDSISDLVSVYSALVENTMQEMKIDRQSLQDRASSAFELLRQRISDALRDHASEVVSCIHESSGEVEETIVSILRANPSLLGAFQSNDASGYEAIDYVPPKTLCRLVDRFPEYLFDGKALNTPYLQICLPDSKATERAREESKERTLAFIKDALRLVSGYSQKVQKNELTRASLSVDFLIKELSL